MSDDHIYPIELEIKDTTYATRSASYIYLILETDSNGRIKMKLYNKEVDSRFPF
jgi:hypothetical protein